MNEGFDPDVVTAYERDTWNRCADDYADTFAGITGETVPLLIESAGIGAGSQVLEIGSGGSQVLEIGSGPGHVADMLVQAGASVTGVDFSANMVDVAQSSFPAITFQQADAEELPFEAESFDAVVANFVVHHLARPNRGVGLCLQCGAPRRNKAALVRSSAPSWLIMIWMSFRMGRCSG